MKNIIILLILSFILPMAVMKIFGYNISEYYFEFLSRGYICRGYIFSFMCFFLGGIFGYIFNIHKLKEGDSHLRYIMSQIYFSLFFYLIILFYNMILASA